MRIEYCVLRSPSWNPDITEQANGIRNTEYALRLLST